MVTVRINTVPLPVRLYGLPLPVRLDSTPKRVALSFQFLPVIHDIRATPCYYFDAELVAYAIACGLTDEDSHPLVDENGDTLTW